MFKFCKKKKKAKLMLKMQKLKLKIFIKLIFLAIIAESINSRDMIFISI